MFSLQFVVLCCIWNDNLELLYAITAIPPGNFYVFRVMHFTGLCDPIKVFKIVHENSILRLMCEENGLRRFVSPFI